MREAGKFYNPPSIQLGKVMRDGKLRIGDLPVEKTDYYIDCNLRIDPTPQIYVHNMIPTEENHHVVEYTRNVLREGDKVLVVKLPKNEKFVVIAKVVDP